MTTREIKSLKNELASAKVEASCDEGPQVQLTAQYETQNKNETGHDLSDNKGSEENKTKSPDEQPREGETDALRQKELEQNGLTEERGSPDDAHKMQERGSSHDDLGSKREADTSFEITDDEEGTTSQSTEKLFGSGGSINGPHEEAALERVASLEAELTERKEELTQLKYEIEDVRKTLEEKERIVTQMKLQQEAQHIANEKQSRKTEEELRDVKSSLCNEISKRDLDMKESERKLKEQDSKLREVQAAFTESSIKWNKDRKRTEQAVQETTYQRKRTNRVRWRCAAILLREQHARKIQKEELVLMVRGLTRQCEGFKLQLTSASTYLENTRQQMNEEIGRLQLELQTVQEEHSETVAELREQLDQSEMEKRELDDHVTTYMYQVQDLQSANNIAHHWVGQMSEYAAQCTLAQQRIDHEGVAIRTALSEKQTEIETLKGVIGEKERQLGETRVEREVYEERQRVSHMKIHIMEGEKEELYGTVALLKEELRKAEGALRRAYQKDEEKEEELKKKGQERRKLVTDIINLRRQLESTQTEKERFRVSCNHLRGDLQQLHLLAGQQENLR